MILLLFKTLSSINIVVILLSSHIDAKPPKKEKVLLLGLDGLRYDFQQLTKGANTLNRLIADGVKAKSMIPAFPSDSWPNWETFMTGLHPESHGIILNSFYDVKKNKTFGDTTQSNAEWYTNNEPIWMTNEKNGGKSAVYWPGVMAHKKKPAYAFDYITNYPSDYQSHKSVVLPWLLQVQADPDVNLLCLWANYPDPEGHKHGPESKKYAEAVNTVDSEVINILVTLTAIRGFNVIVVSDHGFLPAQPIGEQPERRRYLAEYLSPGTYRNDKGGGSATLWARGGATVDDLMANLTALEAEGHYRVYRKRDIPERLHFKNNPNTPEILILANTGWQILDRRGATDTVYWKGVHGYDNAIKEMETVFIASGPAFKRGVEIEKIESVNVYSLLATLLGFEPLPNNGSIESFRMAMKNPLPTKNPTPTGGTNTESQRPSTEKSVLGKDNTAYQKASSFLTLLIVNIFLSIFFLSW